MPPHQPIPGAFGPHTPLDAVPCVRLGPLVGIPAVLQSLGCEPRPLIEKAGFTLAQFADPDLRIPFLPASRLLAQCVAATGCDHFGLLLGERSAPSHLGIAGYLLQSAPDVRIALRGLLDFLELHDEGGVATLCTDREVTLLGYAIHLPGVEAQEQIYDLSAAMIYKILRGLCGDDWRPREVLIMRRPPEAPARYQQFFDAPVRFGSDQTAVAFACRPTTRCCTTTWNKRRSRCAQHGARSWPAGCAACCTSAVSPVNARLHCGHGCGGGTSGP